MKHIHLQRSSLSLLISAVLFAGLALSTGCASGPANRARMHFYSGNATEAALELVEIPEESKDRAMLLMERGTILQAIGNYKDSSADLLEAGKIIETLETISVTENAASMIANDYTKTFGGYPFEQTLVHTFLAHNFLAEGRWQSAGVEARRIIERLKKMDGYPEDAYSRYIAGLCLELLDDPSNARLQYRNAGKLCSAGLKIDDKTGRIGLPSMKKPVITRGTGEMICLVSMDRALTGYQARNAHPGYVHYAYAEFYQGTKYLGRSWPLESTHRLMVETKKKVALLEAAKEIARIAAKDAIADEIAENDALAGAVVGLVLFAMEQPDVRRWETLPRSLQVARFECPPDLSSYRVVFKSSTGAPLKQKNVTSPIKRRGRYIVSICRDLP